MPTSTSPARANSAGLVLSIVLSTSCTASAPLEIDEPITVGPMTTRAGQEPIYILTLDEGARVRYPRRNSSELHLAAGADVVLEIRSVTSRTLTMDGTALRVRVPPGTTFVLVRAADEPQATTLFAWPDRGRAVEVPLVIDPPDRHAEWIRQRDREVPGPTVDEVGRALFATKGCIACHGSERDMGGSLCGLLGTQRDFTDGSHLVLDDATLRVYVRESIVSPLTRVVLHTTPVMPQIQLSNDEVDCLVAYVRCMDPTCSVAPGCIGDDECPDDALGVFRF